MVAIFGRVKDPLPLPDMSMERVHDDRISVFSLTDLVAQCAFDWANRTRDKGLALVSHTGEFPRGSLQGQPQLLRAALDILLNNAVRFTERGSVSLDCRAGPLRGNQLDVQLRVGDTGIGFASERRHLICSEPGLTEVQDLVAAMGGRFDIESTDGRGTLVSFTIPMTHEPARSVVIDVGPSPTRSGLAGILSGRAHAIASDAVNAAEARRSTGTAPGVPATPPGARRARLLLVDSTRMNQTVISALLLRSGYRLDVVDSGAAAVSASETEAYDLILMDMNMPEMDGYEASARIRARSNRGARVPIIALGGSTGVDATANLDDIGITEIVAKPLDRGTLISVVQRVLEETAPTVARIQAG